MEIYFSNPFILCLCSRFYLMMTLLPYSLMKYFPQVVWKFEELQAIFQTTFFSLMADSSWLSFDRSANSWTGNMWNTWPFNCNSQIHWCEWSRACCLLSGTGPVDAAYKAVDTIVEVWISRIYNFPCFVLPCWFEQEQLGIRKTCTCLKLHLLKFMRPCRFPLHSLSIPWMLSPKELML